jgi:anti-sigma factor RsiW
MNCRKVNDLLSDYVSECLPENQCRLLESHIRECGGCAAELEALNDMRKMLRALSGREAPVRVWNCIRDKVVDSPCSGSCWVRWFMRPVVVAPTIAVLFLLTIFVIFPSVNSGQTNTVQALVSAPEYGSYISAHSVAQRQQPFNDPDVAFVAAELDKASFVSADRP